MIFWSSHFAYGSRIILVRDISPDTYDDCLGAKIRRIQEISGWTAEKRRLQRELEVMSPYFGYVGLHVDPREYLLHLVGQSFQYHVPLNKRGRLAQFRGKRVRMVCLGSGTFTRWIRVGPVNPLDVEAGSPERTFVDVHGQAWN